MHWALVSSVYFCNLFPATKGDGKKMSKRLKNYPDPQEFGINHFFLALVMCKLISSASIIKFRDMLHGISYGKESYAKLTKGGRF